MKKLLASLKESQLKATFIILLFLIFFIYLVILTYPINNTESVYIPKGLNASQIAEHLYNKGIIRDRYSFILATKLLLKSKSLKAGRFYINNANNLFTLINILSRDAVAQVKVTIPEGYTIKQIAEVLEVRLGIKKEEFIALTKNDSILKLYNIMSPTLEGYLFPDTYVFSYGVSAGEVIHTMISRFFQVINDSIREVINNSEWDLNKVLTLASIVEGECKYDFERPIVASLYINRLKKRMRLEADPTIQYIIPDGPRRIYSKDLEIDSPYNTYKYKGLPPGPVNNPGLKSILAVLNPANTKYLYMVHNGDGTHTFTHDYKKFLKAKNKLQKIRKYYLRLMNGIKN